MGFSRRRHRTAGLPGASRCKGAEDGGMVQNQDHDGKDDGQYPGHNGTNLFQNAENLAPGIGRHHAHRCGIGVQIGVFKFFLKQLLQGLLIHPTPLKEQLYPLSGDHLTPQIGVDQADRLSDFRVIEIGSVSRTKPICSIIAVTSISCTLAVCSLIPLDCCAWLQYLGVPGNPMTPPQNE